MSGILQGVLASIGGAPATYIEDVFSTWLYTGNGTTNPINNGIDLAGKGGLVWIKSRTSSNWHVLTDTARGAGQNLFSNDTSAQQNFNQPTFTSNGFNLSLNNSDMNGAAGQSYASWTFRKQPKFFDVVTYTGNGVAGRTVAHSLGSVPGMIIIKCTNVSTSWAVYHRGVNGGTNPQNFFMFLNDTMGQAANSSVWNNTAPTDTNFTVGTANITNQSGNTYVAYLFAHDAGGFGLTGTDNVISCGSFTTDGSGVATISLGYEPQYVIVKRTNEAENWYTFDVMRGWSQSSDAALNPNLSDGEFTRSEGTPTATGFTWTNGFASSTYIYMAIRRGPMKTPELGTSVFNPMIWTGDGSTGRTLTTGLPSQPDLSITQWRDGQQPNLLWDKLRGLATVASVNSVFFRTPVANAESPLANYFYLNNMNSVGFGAVAAGVSQINGSGTSMVAWNFRRAPGFMDVVCYTGTGVNRTVTHNLGVVPEFMIVKQRNSPNDWLVYSQTLGIANGVFLNSIAASDGLSSTIWNNTAPTSSVFSVGTNAITNASGSTYVAYLFATVAGVSKVGSYTGTGGTQTINAGLPTGARFVLIKRTDSSGDWWIWDSTRGMVAGTDPRLNLNSQNAEINNNWVYTTTNGFQIVTTDITINANGGSYIYLAIA